MTPAEMDANMWPGTYPPVVIELSTGAKLFPISDEEGNSPGYLVCSKSGKDELLYADPAHAPK